jgi:hypothetical protein
MVTRDEKQRLLRDFHREPVWSLGELLKCAGCLLILISVAVIGPTIDTQWETRGSAHTQSASAHDQQHASAVESKNGSDADRATLEGQSIAPQSRAAH